MNEDRLEQLLDGYFDEALDPAEHAELEALLLSRPQAWELFWKRARFNALLRRRGRESWGRRLAAEPAVGVPLWERVATVWRRLNAEVASGWTWAAVGAATALLVLALFMRFLPLGAEEPRARMAQRMGRPAGDFSQGIATLIRAVGVQWTEGDPRGGNVLSPGWLKFERGLVELQFHRGASVVIEGPAELELITDMQVRCLLGKVRADVPPSAIGFEILSPHVRVVDRGTEFGLEVARNGQADVHVFTGRVDLAYARPSAAPKELRQGAAVRVEPSGAFRSIPVESADFATMQTVERRAKTEMAAHFARWKAHSESLRNDPSVLVQYTFEEESPSDRTLSNRAAGATPETNGAVIGCRWTEGRWPGKRALDFKQLGDRIRFALPREHQSLTCIASLRLDALDHRYIALLMASDGAVGEVQWQIEGDGTVSVGKRISPGWGAGKTAKLNTPSLLGQQRCGSWVQVAFVYDASTKRVTQYVDGQPAGQAAGVRGGPLITGALEIGNWTPVSGEPWEPIRNFNGRMDEFVVFSRALSAEEMERFWAAGRPR